MKNKYSKKKEIIRGLILQPGDSVEDGYLQLQPSGI
jgi:hypothetical protein